ncbi:MAG: dodecin domain-containing protein, partial [Candidatus Limnocylindria bacterium]|nr:dodecin domain-containing protein [Candidatus Limnocylindria bacterium]
MAVAKKVKPARVVRLHEAHGSSRRGWEAAVAAAVRSARDEVPAPLAVEVARQWAEVQGGAPSLFHVTVRIAYEQALV